MKTQTYNSVKDQTATCDNNVLVNRLLGNKENKYRIWDFSKKEMTKTYSINDLNHPHKKALLYINQKDCNEDEIYEGDFVRVGGLVELIVILDGILCAYNYKIHGEINKITVEDENDVRVYDAEHFKSYEIIGNIFQNPEFLTQ